MKYNLSSTISLDVKGKDDYSLSVNLITRKIFFSFFFIFPVLFFNVKSVSLAKSKNKPRIGQFRVSLTSEGFVVSAKLHRAFKHNVQESIQAGIPITFYYHLKLKKIRWYWGNRVVKETLYSHTVTYDTLKKTYTIVVKKHDGLDDIQIFHTDDSAQMKKIMSHFKGFMSLNTLQLKNKKNYYLSLDAFYKSNKIPPPWNTILFFLNQGFKTQTSRYFLHSRK